MGNGVFRRPFSLPRPSQNPALGALSAAVAPLAAEAAAFAIAGQDVVSFSQFVCEPASFAVAAQDAVLIAAQPLAAEAASFAIAGQDLLFSETLVAAQASFTYGGQDAGGSLGFVCGAAAFSLDGQNVNLIEAVNLAAAAGAFAISGQGLAFAGALAAEAASYALDGQAIGQAWAAAPAAFTWSGQAAGMTVSLSLAPGAFALAGQAANQRWAADSAAFTIAGQAAVLWSAIGLVASPALFLIAGKPIWSVFAPDNPGEGAVAEFGVVEFPGSSGVSIATAAAAFSIAGQALTFRPSLSAEPASFAIAGQAANQAWSVSPASFTWSGQSISFTGVLTLEAGAFVVSGQAIGQAWSADAASFAINGLEIVFTEARTAETASFTISPVNLHFLDLEPASFTFDGQALAYTASMAAETGAYTINGQDVTFLNNLLFDAEAGAFTFTGQDIGFGRGVGAETGAFAIAGQDVSDVIRLLCDAASFALTGRDLAFNVAFGLAAGHYVLLGVAVADVLGPSGDHIFLIEVQGHDGDDIQTFYLSDEGFTSLPSDTIANQFWMPRVMDAGNFKQVTGLPGENTVSASAGNVVLANASPGNDENLDDWLDMGFGGRPIIIRALPVGATSLSEATVLLRARVNRLISTRPLEQMELTIRNKLADLEQPLLTTRFAGTTTSSAASAEGNADLKGQIKQQVWGEAAQVLLQPANVYDLIYHASLVTDESQLVSITVFDSGLELTLDGDDANIATLRGATIAAGHYRTCLASGVIRLGSSPTGAVTANIVEGTTAADRTAAQIVKRQLLQFGIDEADLSDGSFDDLDNANDAICYSVVDDDRPAVDEMQAILNSVGGRLLPNASDLFAVSRFEAPTASPTLDFEIEEDVIAETLQRLEGSPVAYQVELGWGRVHHPQAEAQLAGAVSDEDKAYLAKDLRTSTATDLTVKTKHLDARVISYETRLAYQADAEAEATRILDLMKVERDEYSVTLPLRLGWAAQVGGSIVLRHTRLGLSGGKAFAVLERSDVYAEETVGLDRVWG